MSVASPHWVGSDARLRWAMLRAGWPAEKCGIWMTMPLSVGDVRILARDADVALAALLLPDPSRWQMFRAWIYGLSQQQRRYVV